MSDWYYLLIAVGCAIAGGLTGVGISCVLGHLL